MSNLSTSIKTATLLISTLDPIPANTRHVLRIDLANSVYNEGGGAALFATVNAFLAAPTGIICRLLAQEPRPEEVARWNFVRVLSLEIENTLDVEVELEDVKLELLGIGWAPRPGDHTEPARETLTPSTTFSITNTDGITAITASSTETGPLAGYPGWAPELAVVEDGERRVLQVADWVGGEGTKPEIGQYVGEGGLVDDIEDGVDVRGSSGGQGYGGTSTSSIAIGIGSKVFATQTGLAYLPNASRVRVADASNADNFVEGIVTGYSSGNLSVDVDYTSGSGTISNWRISLVGDPGFGWGYKGADIASAATITLPAAGDTFDVTGTVGIATINTAGRNAGSRFTLVFEDELLITSSGGLQMRSQGYFSGANYTTKAGDRLHFVVTGTNTVEQDVPANVSDPRGIRGTDLHVSSNSIALPDEGDRFDVTNNLDASTGIETIFTGARKMGERFLLHCPGGSWTFVHSSDLSLLGGANYTLQGVSINQLEFEVMGVDQVQQVVRANSVTADEVRELTEKIQDVVAAFLTEGAGIDFTYDDVSNTFTVVNSSPLTAEAVQDVVGAMVTNGANVTATYDDGAGTLTIAAAGSSTLTTEDVQDIVGALLAQGTNVTLNYDDTGNLLTITAAGGATIASQAEAEAGVDNTKMMTPLRTAQAIAEQGGGGSALIIEKNAVLRLRATGAGATGDFTFPATSAGAGGAVNVALGDSLTTVEASVEALAGVVGASVTGVPPLAADNVQTNSETLPTARQGIASVYYPITKRVYNFGGGDGATASTNQITEYDTRTDKLALLNTVLPVACEFANAVYDPTSNKIFIFGGRTGSTYYSHIFRFDPETKTIRTLSTTLPAGRTQASAARGANGKIYLFGGTNSSTLNSILEFDPALQTIATKTAVLPTARRLGGAALNPVDGKIYIFGGSNAGVANNNILTYETGTDTITTLTDTLPAAMSSFSCCYGPNGKFLIFGGSDTGNRNKIVEYSPGSNAVDKTAVLPVASAQHGIATDGDLYVWLMGGTSGVGMTTIYQFRPAGTGYYDVEISNPGSESVSAPSVPTSGWAASVFVDGGPSEDALDIGTHESSVILGDVIGRAAVFSAGSLVGYIPIHAPSPPV